MTTLLRRRLRRLHSDEGGTALVLALLVVLLVGATLAAVLDFTRTGLLIAPGAEADRNETTYAQGAVEGAVNAIRGSSTAGRPGWDCPDFAPQAGPDVGVSGHTFRVTCEAQGTTTTNPDGSAQPDFAIHTLDGGSVRQTGNEELTVAGGLYSTGDVTVAAGVGNATPRLVTYGSLFAEGACTTGRVLSTDVLNCPGYADTTGAGADPAWPSAVDIQDDLELLVKNTDADPEPVCDGSVMVFGPGHYSRNPDELAARYGVSCASGNQSVVLHFTPGFYYFDYDTVWDLTGEKVVGGTASGGLTGRPMGVACDPTKPGVQFVFGGQSRLSVASNSSSKGEGLELCGPTVTQSGSYEPGFTQRIALYGATAGQPTRITGNDTLTADAAASAPATAVVLDVDKARIIGGGSALVTAASGRTTTVTLSDLDVFEAGAVPLGASIDRIRVRYNQKPSALTTVAPGVVLTDTPSKVRLALVADGTSYPSAGVTTTLACSTTCEATLVPDSASAPVWRDLQNATLQWLVDGPNGNNKLGAMELDGLEVLVDWTAPTLRPLTCPTSTPGCAFIASGSNPRIHLHGTHYTPASRLDLRVHNSGDTVFARGIVVGSLDVNVSASMTQESAPFQLPGATPAGRKVLFKAYVDGAAQPVVRACVVYSDSAPKSTGGVTAFPGWTVDVHRWVALRTPADGNSCAGVAGG